MSRKPKPFAIIDGEPWWRFAFSYTFEGKEYAFDIPARSTDEAHARLKKIALARYDGVGDGDAIPLSKGGFFAPFICWWRNLFVK